MVLMTSENMLITHLISGLSWKTKVENLEASMLLRGFEYLEISEQV